MHSSDATISCDIFKYSHNIAPYPPIKFTDTSFPLPIPPMEARKRIRAWSSLHAHARAEPSLSVAISPKPRLYGAYSRLSFLPSTRPASCHSTTARSRRARAAPPARHIPAAALSLSARAHLTRATLAALRKAQIDGFSLLPSPYPPAARTHARMHARTHAPPERRPL